MSRHPPVSYGSQLKWPSTTPRSRTRDRGPFDVKTSAVLDDLSAELGRLRATHIAVTSNATVLRSGFPAADDLERALPDPGVAIYMQRKGIALTFTLDRFTTVAANMRGLTLAIRALRSIERYGGAGMEDRALSGFAALPSSTSSSMPTKRHWSAVLAVEAMYRASISEAEMRGELLDLVEMRFKSLARSRHPDGGGTHEAFVELTTAIDEARKELSS